MNNTNNSAEYWGEEGEELGLESPNFALDCFYNLPRRAGEPRKRTVLNEGGDVPASQYCALFKNNRKTNANNTIKTSLFSNS